MTTHAAAAPAPPADYIHAKSGIWSWLTTTDHKRIGLLYLWSIITFFVVAMFLGVLMRLQLLTPDNTFLADVAGQDSVAKVYNRVFTLHGVAMVFLFIIPSIPAVFGNFILPIQVGANDVSFPRLNLASWYFYIIGGLFALVSIALGGPDTGWTFYVPYSATTDANVFFPLTAAFILGWSSILTGLNFITTVHRLRAPGMTWGKLPLFVWGLYATSWIAIVATPVVGITLVMLLVERFLQVGIFDPLMGGDPILFQHLFWIYSHPAVYVMVLPAMGVASEVFPVFSQKRIFGYKFIAASSMLIAAIGSLVWAHHMFTSGMADEARIVFSFLTFLVSIPSAIKVFNWLATMYKGSIRVDVPLLWALSFVFTFLIGGFTGLMQGALGVDISLHDTAFIVAHFHFTMFGGTGAMFFGALHYWFPKMFGRMPRRKPAILGWAMWFVGFNLTYVPLFVAGLDGMPRRYYTYLDKYEIWHQLSTYGSWIMVAGLIIVIVNLILTLTGLKLGGLKVKKGERAPSNPWHGATLEWTLPSPPPTHQFPELPKITHGPYEFEALDEESDEHDDRAQ